MCVLYLGRAPYQDNGARLSSGLSGRHQGAPFNPRRTVRT